MKFRKLFVSLTSLALFVLGSGIAQARVPLIPHW